MKDGWILASQGVFLNVWKLFSGVGENGIENIKAHEFFSSIDWEVHCKTIILSGVLSFI